ncbi:MAG: phosphatidate phosphatase [Streblomastix strix]|uniref:Phosphatidate phosphatase n=1 Tax=Streblomastix strix TaxID=222440 RepID=A0A5J4W956_9EUKA|nr:MAG: phosphatidate phosphatase [Streblomastix strix]
MVSVSHQILRYTILILLSFIPDIVTIVLFVSDPVYHDFSLDDPSLSYEYKKDTISDGDLLIITIVTCFIFSGVYCIFSRNKCQSILSCIISFFFCFGLIQSISFVIKINVGRLRPDFLQRCIPDQEDIKLHRIEDIEQFGKLLSHNFKCTGDPKIVRQGHMSFPSGHSSSISYTFVYCSLMACLWSYKYLFEKKKNKSNQSDTQPLESSKDKNESDAEMQEEGNKQNNEQFEQQSESKQQFDIKIGKRTGMSKGLLFQICLIIGMGLSYVALFIASSRSSDNKHHLSDIIVGFIIGSFVGVLGGYILFYFERVEKWKETDEQVI